MLRVSYFMIIGHQKIWQFLKKSAEAGKLPHAYLFSGQEKLGKKTLAVEFAKWLLNEDIQRRQHPDFIFVEPIKKHPETERSSVRGSPVLSSALMRGQIQISQIKELIRKLSLRPSLAPIKIAIIDQAHSMNTESQSCLLKTLEEPKGNALLILITEYPEALLPTILSRVQEIKFSPAKIGELEDYLKKAGINEKETAEIIKLCQLKPGEMIDLASNPQKLAAQRKAKEELIKISESDLASRFKYAKDLAEDKNNLKEVLELWLKHFRNVFILTANNQISKYSFDKLKKILNTIQRTIFLISKTNANPRLVLEILMLEL